MTSFHFELVSPAKLLFEGAVESVVLPGIEGDMTVMANHAATMTA
ncbi:MAG: F0F1 ATP synthase subunit epsilon, partial [Beijerinckiaceae bacterium]